MTLWKAPTPGVMGFRPFRNFTVGRGKPLVSQVMVTVLELTRHFASGLSITDRLKDDSSEIGSLLVAGGRNEP